MNIFTLPVAIIALSSMVGMTMAQQRTDTRTLQCTGVKNLVQSEGIIVLSTGRNTYDRFVANQSYCDTGDVAVRAYARTRDVKACFIGYTCQPFEGGRGGKKRNAPIEIPR